MSYRNPTPVPAGQKSVNAAWTVTTEDVAGVMNETGLAYRQEAFDSLTDEDVKRITDATTDCINFDHQTDMASYTLSVILAEKGFISGPFNVPDETDYTPDEADAD